MATTFARVEMRDAAPTGLGRRDLALGGPWFDALLLWGAPALSLLFVLGWALAAARLPAALGSQAVRTLAAAAAILTYAHLIAVVPRAYGNRAVFDTHRVRLVAGPLLLVPAMLLSTPLLIFFLALALLWDVHHSAMQTFGIARLYDLRAGNPPAMLRRIDLMLASALYIGPLAAGAGLLAQLRPLGPIGGLGWPALTSVPPLAAAWALPIRIAACAGWAAALLIARAGYARAMRAGYRLPPHKLALLGLTGGASLLAWLLLPPLLAFAAANFAHVAQYFAIVWLKDRGDIARIGARIGVAAAALAFALFALVCLGFGLAYWWTFDGYRLAVAPFVACTLLHFWYDGFVWSVRRRHV